MNLGIKKEDRLQKQSFRLKRTLQAYTCFGCGGNSSLGKKCEICKGTKFISEEHPMARFFLLVLQHKLGFNPSSSFLSETPNSSFNGITSIKEKDSQLEEEKQCNLCHEELPSENYLQCHQCVYNVCATCANQDGLLNHKHQMILKNSDNSYSFDMPESVFFSSNYSGSYRKEGFSDSYSSSQKRPTQKFSFQIPNNSPEAKGQFGVLLEVPENGSMRSVRRMKINVPTIYEQANEHENDNDNDHSHYDIVSKEPSEHFWFTSEKSDALDSVSNLNSQFENKLYQQNLNFQANPQAEERRRKSRTEMFSKFPENDLKFQMKMPQLDDTRPEGCKELVFADYVCNYCEQSPRKNRYHCLRCEDYDLCEQCNAGRKVIHPHHDFECVTPEKQKVKKEIQAQLLKDRIVSVLSRLAPKHSEINKQNMMLSRILRSVDRRK